MARRSRGLKLEPSYVDLVSRLMRLIPEWCASRERLPDLKFWNHGRTMIGAALEPLTYCLLARSPDATDLLEYLDAREPEATIFQTHCALDMLGFLKGSDVLQLEQIQGMMQGKAPTVTLARRR
jgi:hypothetical protein